MNVERKEMKEMIKEALEELRAVDDCYPQEHKLFVERWIKREARRQELWEKAKAQAFGTGLIAVVSYIIFVTWESLHTPSG